MIFIENKHVKIHVDNLIYNLHTQSRGKHMIHAFTCVKSKFNVTQLKFMILDFYSKDLHIVIKINSTIFLALLS